MIRFILIPLALAVLPGCASKHDPTERLEPAGQLIHSQLREKAAHDILRRPIAVEYPQDAALVHALFRAEPARFATHPSTPSLPEYRTFSARPIALQEALIAVAHASGFAPARFDPDVDPLTLVVLPDTTMDLTELMRALAKQAGVVISIFPQSRTILVMPEV